MTAQELSKLLEGYVKQGNCFTKEVRQLLVTFKESGGEKEIVVEILNRYKNDNPNNETIQDGADDILDIVTGYCGVDMRVWTE